jgi:hypothetical protein
VDDLDMLLGWLGAKRRHVRGAVEGLSEEDLRRPVLPSGWSCLGLVNHLAEDVERFWGGHVLAGVPFEPGATDGWTAPEDLTGGEVLAAYDEACARTDEAARAAGVGRAPQWWPDFFGDWRMDSTEEVLVHLLTETATHAGHLDAAVELIDGRQHLVLG